MSFRNKPTGSCSAALRTALLLGTLGLFIFARVAFAGEACASSSAACLPSAPSAPAHDGYHVAEICATQIASPNHPAAAASSDSSVHSGAAPSMASLMLMPAAKPARPVRGEPVRGAPSLLSTSGRLRL